MGVGEPVVQSVPMMMGTMLEEAIGNRIGAELSTEMHHATMAEEMIGFQQTAIHLGDGTFRSKKYPRLIVTPDYVSEVDGGGYYAEEIKCVGRWSGLNLFSPPSASKIRYPESYAVQVVAQVGTLGLDGGRLWALVQNGRIPDKEVEWLYNESLTNPEHFRWWAKGYVSRQALRCYEIPYSEDKFNELGETATKFWVDHVETGKANPAWRPVVRPSTNPQPVVDATDNYWGETMAPEECF